MAELGATFDLYHHLSPSIIGLQETNKNWNCYDATIGRIKQSIQRRWPGSKLTTAHCSEDVFHGPSQPGGVAQMILRQLTARVIKHGKDPYGRFTWHETMLDGTRNLLVVTAYRVSQRRIKGCGPTTSIMQQWRQLRAKGIDNPNLQQQMLDDLATFLKPHIQAGNEVILMIDANDSIESRPMDEFMDSLDLWDLMADFLPTTPPPTYHRGSKKIDHIIGTQGILFATRRAYILPFGSDSPKSDHAICGIDVSLELLCGMSEASTNDPTHPSTRNLWSTDVKAAEKYIEMAMQMFETDNIANRTKVLIDRCTRTGKCTEDDERILNAIDANITHILLTLKANASEPMDMTGRLFL